MMAVGFTKCEAEKQYKTLLMLKNVKLILLDMDGVLFDSRLNMQLSWRDVQKKFVINKSFNQYFRYAGIPFKNILRKIIGRNFHPY